MGGHYCYITHFKGEKMEAQQDSVTCPSLSASKWQRIFLKWFIYLYFWLHWVFVPVCGLSLVVPSRGYSSLGYSGFSSCGARAVGSWASVVVALGLGCSVACGIFLNQGLNQCPLQWMLIHCTTREVPKWRSFDLRFDCKWFHCSAWCLHSSQQLSIVSIAKCSAHDALCNSHDNPLQRQCHSDFLMGRWLLWKAEGWANVLQLRDSR